MKRYAYWLDEVGQGDLSLLGKKSANLGEMTRIGLKVPRGFAISLHAYEDFLKQTGLEGKIEKIVHCLEEEQQNIDQFISISEEIRYLIESCEMPDNISSDIVGHYRELSRRCGVADPAVSTRSSGPVSRPGQYETCLNVIGECDVLEKVKRVWASSFNPRSLAFRAANRLPLASDPIGVAVIGMVNARSAGVLFTADPNTGDTSRIIVEANWGLGESVVSGEVTPDIYVLAKDGMKVASRTLGRKSRCVSLRQVGVAEEDVPDDRRSVFCLSDAELESLAEAGLILEKHFGAPQDVEWAIEENTPLPQSVIILQSRAAVLPAKKDTVDQVVDLMLKWL